MGQWHFLSVVARFYETRTGQDNENPEGFHSRLILKPQKDAIASVKNQLGPLLAPSVVSPIQQSISGMLDIPNMLRGDGSAIASVKKREAQKRFGKFIWSPTADQGVELLFNELIRLFHPRP